MLTIKSIFNLTSVLLIASSSLWGCANSSPEQSTGDTPPQNQTSQGTGTLKLVANGEDFIRQGFVTKDGWSLEFEEVHVTLAEVKAYQTNPPYDADSEAEIQAQQTVTLLDTPQMIDLAAGDENAPPIAVSEQAAPSGLYNALSWKIIPAQQGHHQGHAIALKGTATKDGQTLKFNLSWDQELNYTCGEFVGEERKGFVKDQDTAEVETTFHFDHIFGDGTAPPADEINTGAIGFAPFAALAENGDIQADRPTLEAKLDPTVYKTLATALVSLGHVGEGHCRVKL